MTTTLRELGDGTYAYLQQGGWGFSNAGLVTSRGASLLIDTLYDVRSAEAMLALMREQTPLHSNGGQIDSVVNTHANGDHCWGNQAVGNAKIISSRAAAEEMLELSPKLMHTLVTACRQLAKLGMAARLPLSLLGRLGIARAGALAEAAPFVVDSFGAFDFGRVSLRVPDTTFSGQLTLRVGDKDVQLIEVGPAHTKGDVIVHVPSDRIVYTGDILFIGSHPIAWEGPLDNWIAACDRILALDAEQIVPGHGPITDKRGVQTTRDYWLDVKHAAQRVHETGQSITAAASELARKYDWRESERSVVNIDTAYRELTRDTRKRDPLLLMAQMARQARAR